MILVNLVVLVNLLIVVNLVLMMNLENMLNLVILESGDSCESDDCEFRSEL